MPVPQMSIPPTTAATFFVAISWAQRCDRSGLNAVSQVMSSSGCPSIPSSSVLMNSTATLSAWVSSGNAPAAPVSWLIVPIRMGVPVALVAFAGRYGDSIESSGAHATIEGALSQSEIARATVVLVESARGAVPGRLAAADEHRNGRDRHQEELGLAHGFPPESIVSSERVAVTSTGRSSPRSLLIGVESRRAGGVSRFRSRGAARPRTRLSTTVSMTRFSNSAPRFRSASSTVAVPCAAAHNAIETTRGSSVRSAPTSIASSMASAAIAKTFDAAGSSSTAGWGAQPGRKRNITSNSAGSARAWST